MGLALLSLLLLVELLYYQYVGSFQKWGPRYHCQETGKGLPWWLYGEESINTKDTSSIPGLGRSHMP